MVHLGDYELSGDEYVVRSGRVFTLRREVSDTDAPVTDISEIDPDLDVSEIDLDAIVTDPYERHSISELDLVSQYYLFDGDVVRFATGPFNHLRVQRVNKDQGYDELGSIYPGSFHSSRNPVPVDPVLPQSIAECPECGGWLGPDNAPDKQFCHRCGNNPSSETDDTRVTSRNPCYRYTIGDQDYIADQHRLFRVVDNDEISNPKGDLYVVEGRVIQYLEAPFDSLYRSHILSDYRDHEHVITVGENIADRVQVEPLEEDLTEPESNPSGDETSK